MEYRKIIEFGKSSYVVSLPKSWLKDRKLGKGDTVYVGHQGDNLIFSPAKADRSKHVRKAAIDVTNMTKDEIRIQIISHYIRNFNEITLTADNMQSKAKEIRTIIHDMMALEVVEEDASKIVTKDFIHTDDISPMELLKKMDMITQEMILDAKNTFKEDRYANISERDTDVNRLSYLVFRTLRNIQTNPGNAREKGFDHDMYLAMWMAAVKIESIADDTKRIAKLMRRLDFGKSETKQFERLYSLIEKYYKDCMKAFYSRDTEAAFKLISQKKKLIKQCRDFYRQNWNHEWVSIIMEKMKSQIASSKSLMTYVCDTENKQDTP